MDITQYHIATEGMFFSGKDIELNLDDWERVPGKNILFVTGFSGSGKTTIAEKMERLYPNTYMFEIDSLDHGAYDASRIGLLDKFKQTYPQHANSIGKRDTMRFKMTDMLRDMIALMYTMGDKLFILEGIQIFEFLEPEEMLGKPMIIKGTSAITSIRRRMKRGGEKATIEYLRHLWRWYSSDNKEMKKMKKVIM